MTAATPFAQDPDALELELLESRAGYRGFFAIDVHRLRHRRFDGSMTEVMTRETFERGNAAAVLPYDPYETRFS